MPCRTGCRTPAFALARVVATAPTITTYATQSMEESERAVVTMAATGEAPLTWSITDGDDAAYFKIDEDTGELTMSGSANFENREVNSEDNTYQVGITATVSQGFDDLLITAMITDERQLWLLPPAGRRADSVRGVQLAWEASVDDAGGMDGACGG